jgi:simple sugar transport system ATP-binding protein
MVDRQEPSVFEAVHITKQYGTVLANDDLTLTVNPAEILGVLGENGAGKSTLLSILAGMIQPDLGQLRIDGTLVTFGSPRDAIQAGISLVYQHFSLIPTFTIREQLRLVGWNSPALPELLQHRFSGDERIDRLSLGERQVVEIARALVSQPRFLLLDEPTSILTSAETTSLFQLLQTLRTSGTSIVIVTHKLREAMAVCDRIVVLRHGAAVGSIERASTGWREGFGQQLLRFMFGAVTDPSPDAPSIVPNTAAAIDPPPEPAFAAKHLTTLAAPGVRELRDIDLELNPGEICAIAGVDGQGQRELAEVCGGYRPARGEIRLNGNILPAGNAPAFRHAGIAYLTGDRLGEGTVPDFSIARNLIMKRQREWPFSRFGSLRHRFIREQAVDQMTQWDVQPRNPDAAVATLSGGNVQKLLLAREMSIASSLIVANNPTHGLDVKTQNLVWQSMRQFVANGGSVLVFLTDLDEAINQADRIAVMFDGRVSLPLPASSGIRSRLEQMMVAGW